MDLIHLVRAELRSFPNREVFLMGESFGGLLAMGTALERSNRPDTREASTEIKGVILVNPATSYSRTIWAKFGGVITKLPEPLYGLSLLPIGLLLVDGGQIQSIVKDAFDRLRESRSPSSGEQRAKMAALGLSPFHIEFFSAALPVLIERLNLLPAPCLEWRLLQWLGAGSDMVEPQLHRMKTPVLVVAGTVDRLLPSFEEAKRLKRELKDCQVHFVEGAGHGGSLDQRVQLLEILKGWAPVGRVLG
jgi:pimeloyl-ACP methyl ester carboxylesterase